MPTSSDPFPNRPELLACPKASTLERFVVGDLSDDEAAAIEGHLQRCARCQETLPTLTASDELVAAFARQSSAAAAEPTAVVEQLMKQLSDLWRHGATALARNGVRDFALLFAPPSEPGEIGWLGSYRIVRELGTGGMGIVFLALDTQLKRLVALKVLRPDLLDDEEFRERFLREARAAAAIEHDHVVIIHQVGEERGVVFLAMQYLQGQTLEQLLSMKATLRAVEIARIGSQIAEGLAAAHARGLVHRDVTPANIFLARSDLANDSGQPTEIVNELPRVKILDFGLVHAVREASQLTRAGSLAGTPHYMSPEQARGDAVDARSDLFSLGCVMYRMATGRAPFARDTTLGTLSALANEVPRPVREVNPEIPTWLSATIMGLLEKDPAQRPASARLIADSLQAERRLPRRNNVGRKWIPLLIALALLISVLGYGYRQWNAPDETLRLAVIARQVARLEERPASDTEVAELRESLAGFQQEHAGDDLSDDVLAQLQRLPWPVDELRRNQIDREELAAAGDGDARNAPPELVAVFGESRFLRWSGNHSVAFSHDDQKLAVGSWEDSIHIWNASAGRIEKVLRGHHIAGRTDKSGEVYTLSYSDDGQYMASGSLDGTVRLWKTSGSAKPRVLPHGGAVPSVAFSPDSATLVTACRDKNARVWDVTSGELRHTLGTHADEVGCIAVSGVGTICATSSNDRTAKLWDYATGEELHTLSGHNQVVRAVAISPDGQTIVTGSLDCTIKLWDGATYRERKSVQVHRAGVHSLRFGPSSQTFAAGYLDGVVQMLDAQSGEVIRTYSGSSNLVHDLAISHDGDTLAAARWNGRVDLWDAATGAVRNPPRAHGSMARAVAFSQTGQRMVSISWDQYAAIIWDLAGHVAPRKLEVPGAPLNAVAFHPSGKQFATGGNDGRIRLWDARTGDALHVLHRHESAVTSLAFSQDGRWLASTSHDGTVRLWKDYASGVESFKLAGHEAGVRCVAFSPDGRLMASGGEGMAIVWSVPEFKMLRVLRSPLGPFEKLVFCLNGRLLASANNPGKRLTLWDVETGHERPTKSPMEHSNVAWFVNVSPDGRSLASTGDDGAVHIWDATDGRLIRSLHLGPPWRDIHFAAFSPEGRHIATANGNGTVYILRVSDR